MGIVGSQLQCNVGKTLRSVDEKYGILAKEWLKKIVENGDLEGKLSKTLLRKIEQYQYIT